MEENNTPQSTQTTQIGSLDPAPASADPTVTVHSSNKKKKIILVGLLVLVVLIAAFIYLKGHKTISNTSSGVKTDVNAVTASNKSDFAAVCAGKTISNAAENTSPHNFALFKQNNNIKDSYSASSIVLPSSVPQASNTNFQDTKIVGCLSHVKETETGRVCSFTDLNQKTVKLKQFNVLYELRVFEAKTGKKLDDQELNAQASSCPTFTDYEAEDQKLFTPPSISELTETINKSLK